MSDANATDRRGFILNLWRSVFAAAGISAVGFSLWDRKGPVAAKRQTSKLQIASFAATGQNGKLAVARGSDRIRNIEAAIDALGGMAQFVQPGDKVLLKVNAAFATPPVLGATTHPDLVARTAALCFAAGAAQVAVTDNPINDPASCFELTGIGPAARKAGARLMLPRPDRFAFYSVKNGQLIRNWPVLGAPLVWADKVIGLAPVKDHHRSGASMTMKNWYGLLGGRRNIFHQQIHTIIAELAVMIRPTLVVLDGTWSMIANGPTGGAMDDLKATHTLIAGTDQVAVDSLGATLLGKSVKALVHLDLAERAGAGTTDYRSLNPVVVDA
ncbi:MAG: DUF362 domain-containing protein [Desulfobacteraceae bacterium]